MFNSEDSPKPILRMLFTYNRTGRTPPGGQDGPLNQPTTDVFGEWIGIEEFETFDDELCSNPPGFPNNTLTTPSPGWPRANH